jgi:serine O-acetyltransferase
MNSGYMILKIHQSFFSNSRSNVMFESFRADINRYIIVSGQPWIRLVLTTQGLWALAEYRFGYWVRTEVHIPVARQVLKLISVIWHKLIEVTTGIDLASEATIGKGLYIAHFGNIFVNAGTRIGENCNLSQGVTIGVGGRGAKQGCPKIGDRVFIGPGAKIFGAIEIGNDVAIGANAVVTKDLPDNVVAVGVPAKIISAKGSQDFVLY